MANDDQMHTGNPESAAPATPPDQPTSASLAEDLQKALERAEKLTQEQRELQDRLLRTAAEFENFKKRTKREMEEAGNVGREQLLKELLPVADNLERALKHAPPGDPLAVGVQQTEKQFLQALEKFGVTRFTALGQPFDPALHEAIQQIETTEVPAGSVAQEFATGYKIGARLLRAAMVAVAKPPAQDRGAEDEGRSPAS